MLEPRALRIGNWITVMGSLPTQVTAYHLYMMETYVPVDPNEADYKEMTQPIELSEEWLKKGQFKKQETETDGQVWQNSKVVLKYRNGQFRLYISDTEDDWFYTTSIVIRYVHTLQNLFYALTGNELIFNHV